MKVSLNWLRDYVPISLSAIALAEKLTMCGIESRVDKGQADRSWDNVVIGQVVGVAAHPNADRLRLATVDLGRERVTVVCGAPNVAEGQRVPFARLGARLVDYHTGQGFELKPARIRGVVSEGMICSEKELGISDSHEGIMVLPAAAPLGLPLGDYLADVVLDLEVTPNRPDCLSVIGIAREVAALTGEKVHLPPGSYEESGPPADELISVNIADPDLCGRYCAGFIEGVKLGASPAWMQERLAASGMRPINNIVDVTNYVMLEYGQPLHAFDYDRIGGRRIVVRRARSGEAITTLDGVERCLTTEMLVIADAQVPVALAGVMGGAGSEVTEGTARVLLESASFNMVNIRHTSRGLGLQSEASLRFERGISSELTVPALRRATRMILEIAGGRASPGMVDVYPGKKEGKRISLPASEVKRLLGMAVSLEKMRDTLASLGFECRQASDAELEVQVPYWRTDINLPVDLVEEIARITGYDQIPATMPSGPLPQQEPPAGLSLRERVRDILVGCGFQEVITYSLTSRERAGFRPEPLRVAHPMSSEQEYLRTTLRPNLLALLASNQRHEKGSLRLFEVGRVYLPRESDLPEEREMLVGLLTGPRRELSWLGDGGYLDYFDARGVVEALLERLGMKAEFRPDSEEGLHPGRTAGVVAGGERVGVVGELHPGVAGSWELLPQPVALFELEVGRLLAHLDLGVKYQPLPRFPDSVRDIALIVDERIPAARMAGIIQGSSLVSKVSLFDVYTGEQVPPGRKSLAFRIVYRSLARTLTLAEVEGAEKEILDRLSREVGAVLRR